MLCREPLGVCGTEGLSDWHKVTQLRSAGVAFKGWLRAVELSHRL